MTINKQIEGNYRLLKGTWMAHCLRATVDQTLILCAKVCTSTSGQQACLYFYYTSPASFCSLADVELLAKASVTRGLNVVNMQFVIAHALMHAHTKSSRPFEDCSSSSVSDLPTILSAIRTDNQHNFRCLPLNKLF